MALIIIRICGWELVGEVPDLTKAVFIAAPHTSNWDGFWLLVAKCALDFDVRFLAKHSLFWWPLGPLLRAFGAMPVDRSVASSTVDVLTDQFAQQERLFVALAPEGTRKLQAHWRSGFYQIAKAANVPIVLAFIDYSRKRMGIGITLPLNRSAEEDIRAIRDFYEPCIGRRPECSTPVKFPP